MMEFNGFAVGVGLVCCDGFLMFDDSLPDVFGLSVPERLPLGLYHPDLVQRVVWVEVDYLALKPCTVLDDVGCQQPCVTNWFNMNSDDVCSESLPVFVSVIGGRD